MSNITITDELIRFWFETLDTTAEVDKREVWFKATPEFDASIAYKFTDAYEQAANSKLDYLANDQFGCLTLIILLDQIPRNLFRHSGKAYATDDKALSVARGGLENGYDRNMSSWHKVFFYLPFEHSEKINDQNFSVRLFKDLEFESAIEAAIDHQKIIKKYGRFPYRNEALGRTSTPEEKEFLKTPPPWGKTKAEFDALAGKKAG